MSGKVAFRIFSIVRLYITKMIFYAFIFFILLGSFYINYRNELYIKFDKYINLSNNNKYEIIGTIVTDKVEKEYYDLYKLKVEKINGKKIKNVNVFLNVERGKNIKYGDLIKSVSSEYIYTGISKNYKGFNYKEYLKTVNVQGIFKVKSVNIKIIKCNNLSKANLVFNRIKNSLLVKINELYKNEENRALISGMILGIKDELSDNQLEKFKSCNLLHILAISGMHISYIIAFFMFILRLLKIPKKIINILSIFLIISFMWLINFTPSVMRAGICYIMALLSFLLIRRSDIWISMSISSLILLIYNPFILYSLSFQFSYLGTIGIICGIKILKHEKLELNNKIYNYVINSVFICLAVQIVILPIMLLNFNTFPLYFFISNVLISPVIGIIIMLAFIVISISYIDIHIAFLLNWIEKLLLSLLNVLTNSISFLPNTIIYNKTPFYITVVLYYVIIAFITVFKISNRKVIKKKIIKIIKKNKRWIISFFIFYILFIFLLDCGFFKRNNLQINFIDVGQGDSTLITTFKNKKILIDGGGSENDSFDVGENILLPYLLDRRILKIDYIIVSHFDSDHIRTVF